MTLAFSVAKFTVAVTPSIRLSFFSTRAAQEAQVIPPMSSSTWDTGVSGVPVCALVCTPVFVDAAGAADAADAAVPLPVVVLVTLVMSVLQRTDRTARSQYQLV